MIQTDIKPTNKEMTSSSSKHTHTANRAQKLCEFFWSQRHKNYERKPKQTEAEIELFNGVCEKESVNGTLFVEKCRAGNEFKYPEPFDNFESLRSQMPDFLLANMERMNYRSIILIFIRIQYSIIFYLFVSLINVLLCTHHSKPTILQGQAITLLLQENDMVCVSSAKERSLSYLFPIAARLSDPKSYERNQNKEKLTTSLPESVQLHPEKDRGQSQDQEQEVEKEELKISDDETDLKASSATIVPSYDQMKLAPACIILVSSKEIAVQLITEARKVTYKSDLKVAGLYGGPDVRNQMVSLSYGVDILIALPVKLNEFLNQQVITLKAVKIVVLDIDECRLSQLPQIKAVLNRKDLPSSECRQTCIFAQSFLSNIEEFVKRFLSPKCVVIGTNEYECGALSTTKQNFILLPTEEDKFDALVGAIHKTDSEGKIIVFVRQRSTATEITQRIKSCCEPNTEELHGNFLSIYIYISEHLLIYLFCF